MYTAYQAHTDLLWPLREATRLSLPLLQDPHVVAHHWWARPAAAAGQVFELA
jgi:poly(3-hydroxybutyrate) depolymerase